MNIKKATITAVVLIVIVSAGWWGYQTFLAPAPETTVAPTPSVNNIAIATGVSLVSAEGRLLPYQQTNLAFQTGGRVAELLVTAGDWVTAGTPLIQLDTAEVDVAVAQAAAAVAQAETGVTAAQAQLEAAQAGILVAQSQVTAAEAQLGLAQAPLTSAETAALEAAVRATNAAITQASASRDAAVAGATDGQLEGVQAQLAAAQAQARTLQTQYDQIIQAGIGGPTEEQARFALAAANAAVTAAQAQLSDLNGGATSAQRRAADAAVAVATAQRDAAQAQLDLGLSGAKPEQITIAQAGVAQAEAALVAAQTAVTIAVAAVTQAEAAVTQAEAAQQGAVLAQSRLLLLAPVDGRVLQLLPTVGELVVPGQPVGWVADDRQWQVETTDLTELDIVAVTVGMPVQVRIDAIPNQLVQGVVTDISAVAALSRGDITYAVTIDLADTARLPLRWGMTAFVDIDVTALPAK